MKNAKESTRVSLFIFLFTAALLLEHVLSYAVISRFFAVREIKTEGVLQMLLWLVPLFYMAVLSIHYAMLQNFVQSFQLVRLIAKPMLLLLMCICLYYLTTGGRSDSTSVYCFSGSSPSTPAGGSAEGFSGISLQGRRALACRSKGLRHEYRRKANSAGTQRTLGSLMYSAISFR